MNWTIVSVEFPRILATQVARGVLVRIEKSDGGSLCFIPDSRIDNSDNKNPKIVSRTETR